MSSTRAVVTVLAVLVTVGAVTACSAPDVECTGDTASPVPLGRDTNGDATLDLTAEEVEPAREGCEFERTAALAAPDDQIWLPSGLSADGRSVVVRYDLAGEGEQESGPGVGVASESGDVRWLRDPADTPPGDTWLTAVTDRWAVWGDGLGESDMLSLGAEFWAADQRTGEVRRVGDTARTADGSFRTVPQYNRPTIVGDWLFWVDPVIQPDGTVSGTRVVGVALTEPEAPVEVASDAYLTGVDQCGAEPALVYLATAVSDSVDESGRVEGVAEVRRVAAGDGGVRGESELVTTISTSGGTEVTDLAVCGDTVAWSVTEAVAIDEDTGLEANRREVLWIEREGMRLLVTGQESEMVRDVSVSTDWVGFSDVSITDGLATHYLYRLDDGALFTVPTTLGLGQAGFQVSGSHASWFELRPGATATDSMADLQRVVARLLPPDGPVAG